MEGLDYEYEHEDERKFFAEIPNLAKKVGISPGGALALAKLIVKHKPPMAEPEEGATWDCDVIDRETAKANEKIKEEAPEVMSADDVAKLDDIFALFQQQRDEYRAKCEKAKA